MSTLEEKVARAWTKEGWNWRVVDGVPDAEVYRMGVAHVDDKPVFQGTFVECRQFVDRHCARAAIAAVLAEMEDPSNAMLDAAPYAPLPGCGAYSTWRAMFAAFKKEHGI